MRHWAQKRTLTLTFDYLQFSMASNIYTYVAVVTEVSQ